ncbi:MAG: RNA polymerase sigma factor [Bacteroidota bacterium]
MLSTEQELLKKLMHGDVLAFERVFKKYNRKIYAFSFRYLKNKEDAEGIVQEVFLKLWENHSKLKRDSNINAWLFTVTFNAIRKRFRKFASEKKHMDGYSKLFLNQQDEITDSEYFDLLEKANHLIDKLPPQQKKVFLLRKDKGLTSIEMSIQLNLSKKTVENHLNRARAFLKKAMMEEGLLSFLFFWLFLN